MSNRSNNNNRPPNKLNRPKRPQRNETRNTQYFDDHPGLTSRSNLDNPDKPTNGKNQRRKGRGSSNFAVFYLVTLLIGVAVCVALVVFGYQHIIGDSDESPFSNIVSRPTTTPRPAQIILSDRITSETTIGMIVSMEPFTEPRIVTLHLLESGRREHFQVPSSTSVVNRHGTVISFGELSLGQIVDIQFDSNTNDVSSLNLSNRAFMFSNQRGLNFDSDTTKISMGNRVYDLSSQTMILNQGEQPSLSNIKPEDVFTVWGYGDKIWSLRLDSGNGFIHFENVDMVTNANLTIASANIFRLLESDTTITMGEATHRILVTGENIQPFHRDVLVRQNQTTTIDLTEVTPLSSNIQLMLNNSSGGGWVNAATQTDVSVFINGSAVDFAGSFIPYEYGTHTLRVERTGFIPIQQEIDIVVPVQRIEVEMIREIPIARIEIETFPSDAEIFLDHALIGSSPTFIEVENGNYLIVARKPGYEDYRLSIEVTNTSPRRYMITMRQLPAHIPEPTPTPTPSPTPFDPTPTATPWPDLPPHLQEPVPTPVIPQDWDWPSNPADSIIPPELEWMNDPINIIPPEWGWPAGPADGGSLPPLPPIPDSPIPLLPPTPPAMPELNPPAPPVVPEVPPTPPPVTENPPEYYYYYW